MYEIIEAHVNETEYLTDILELSKKLYDNDKRFVENKESRFNTISKLNKPDTKIFLIARKGKVIGHTSLIPNLQLKFNDYKIATLGFYECIDDKDASNALLSHSQKYAKSLGLDYIVGPLDYATWFSYRFVHPSPNPPVYLEPYNKDYYIDQFLTFGFHEIAEYYTYLVEKPFGDPRFERVKHRLEGKGIEVRKTDFRNELPQMYEAEKEFWKKQFLYMDISYDEFLISKSKIPDIVDKDFTYGFYHPELGLCGFWISIPDLYDESGKTIMAKSIGRLDKKEIGGLGLYATYLAHEEIFKKYPRLLHALMRKDTESARYFKDEVQVYKKFSLYGKEI
jgi:hypothetical protein